jgi:hypothetical protein
MGEFIFGCGNGRVSNASAKRIRSIAAGHGATFLRYTEPRGERRYLFTAPNRGEPFNSRLEEEVLGHLVHVRLWRYGHGIVGWPLGPGRIKVEER